ncbi:MAG TPA: hypothetical protein VF832_11200 [Longimicrobiales bacterium]
MDLRDSRTRDLAGRQATSRGAGMLNLALAATAGALAMAGCSRSNNLLLGRVQAELGGHTVVVTDCYRTSVPAPQASPGQVRRDVAYRWLPCRDADVRIRGGVLEVNGRSYGRLAAGVPVTVDHGRVSTGTSD